MAIRRAADLVPPGADLPADPQIVAGAGRSAAVRALAFTVDEVNSFVPNALQKNWACSVDISVDGGDPVTKAFKFPDVLFTFVAQGRLTQGQANRIVADVVLSLLSKAAGA